MDAETLSPMPTGPTRQKSQGPTPVTGRSLPGVPAASGAPGVLGAGSSGVVAADVEAAGGVAAAVDEPCGACGDRGLGARATSKTLGPMRAQARLMGLTYAWSSTSSSSYFTVRPAVGTPMRCPSGSNAPPPELPWAILASVLI